MSAYLDKLLLELERYPYGTTIILSLVLIAFLLVIKKLVNLNLAKKKIERSEKVFLKKRINQYLNIIFILFLFGLWFFKLQIVFVSLFAVAAAVVIAFKELIMCMTGGFYLRQSHLFKEGQRIEIGGIRGFVIEKSFLSTKVLEIGPEKNSQQTTGDVIAIPNSLFLSDTLKNESYFKGYSIKSYFFKLNISDDVEALEDILLRKSKDICAPYIENAKRSISHFCEKEGIVIPSVEPRTKVVFEDVDKVVVIVKLPVENIHIADIEQSLNRLTLKWRREQLLVVKEES